jgi:hypothetical protein
VPETVAVKLLVCELPAWTVALVGVMETPTVGFAETVIVAVVDFVGSAALVARNVAVPVVDDGAV